MPSSSTPKNLVSIPAIFRNANGSSQTRKRSANRSRSSVYHHIFLAPGHAPKPVNQPRPEETSDIEWRTGRRACFCSCKAPIELGGKIGNQPAAKLEDQARTRELGERALQAVFHGHENPGLLPPSLRYQAIEDFTLGP